MIVPESVVDGVRPPTPPGRLSRLNFGRGRRGGASCAGGQTLEEEFGVSGAAFSSLLVSS